MASFQGKYEVLSTLSDGESQSFRALQISSGRPVLVHHLAASRAPSQQPDLASLIFKFLRSASVEQSRNFLDMGEEEGRIFVVTADVPECLDLRQWLQSVTEAPAGKGGEAQPVGEGTPDFQNIELTRNFTTRALRQDSRFPLSEPVTPSPGPATAPPAVPPLEKSQDALIPPLEIPATSSEDTDRGPKEISSSEEKSSPTNLAESPATIPASPPLLKDLEGPSVIPEVTQDFLSRRSSLSDQDAPTAEMPTLQAQSAGPRGGPAAVAGAAEAKGGGGRFADGGLTSPEVLKPPLAPQVAEVSTSSSQPAVPPVAHFPETQTPQEFTGLLVEKDKAPQPDAALSPAPHANDEQEVEEKVTERVPRRQVPMGFEVVFQSSRPRSHPTLSGAPGQSGIMTAPVPIPTAEELDEATPTLATTDLPKVVPPALSPGGQRIGAGSSLGFPPPSAEPKRPVMTRKEPAAAPLPPRSLPTAPESEKATRLVPTPQVPPGEYTRMIENVKAVAGPLPPVGPPGAQTPVPLQASSLRVPSLQAPPYPVAPPQSRPSVYLAKGRPAPGHKRKVWVPILILGSLFLLTVTLLLFFAYKP